MPALAHHSVFFTGGMSFGVGELQITEPYDKTGALSEVDGIAVIFLCCAYAVAKARVCWMQVWFIG